MNTFFAFEQPTATSFPNVNTVSYVFLLTLTQIMTNVTTAITRVTPTRNAQTLLAVMNVPVTKDGLGTATHVQVP